jgi:hypothetical protein
MYRNDTEEADASTGAKNPPLLTKGGGGSSSSCNKKNGRTADRTATNGDDSMLCLARFRLVPVPETHTAFLAVQYTPLPASGPHLFIPPPAAVPPRRMAPPGGQCERAGV